MVLVCDLEMFHSGVRKIILEFEQVVASDADDEQRLGKHGTSCLGTKYSCDVSTDHPKLLDLISQGYNFCLHAN